MPEVDQRNQCQGNEELKGITPGGIHCKLFQGPFAGNDKSNELNDKGIDELAHHGASCSAKPDVLIAGDAFKHPENIDIDQLRHKECRDAPHNDPLRLPEDRFESAVGHGRKSHRFGVNSDAEQNEGEGNKPNRNISKLPHTIFSEMLVDEIC